MRLYEYSVRKGIPSLARFITNPLLLNIQQPYSWKGLVSAAKWNEISLIYPLVVQLLTA